MHSPLYCQKGATFGAEKSISIREAVLKCLQYTVYCVPVLWAKNDTVYCAPVLWAKNDTVYCAPVLWAYSILYTVLPSYGPKMICCPHGEP